ncbi:MAG: S8 family serine peptidase, partial [Planctomycetes bacterium]|nr:S8 family serine peptidase [Planctomycetota bacterium]
MHSLATAARVAAFVLTASFATQHAATQAPSGADRSRATHRDAEIEVNRFLVHLQEANLTASKLDALATSIDTLGGRIEHRYGIVPIWLVTIDGSRIAALASLPLVARIEPDRWHCPTIKTSTDAAHHASDALTTRGITGKGATVGIIDTGIDEALSASPPSANLFPGLPGHQRLTPGQRVAIRVPAVPAGKVGGFDLWCGAAQNVTLPLTVHADRNGLPDPTPLTSSRLAVARDADFVNAPFATPISLTAPTTLWFAFTPPNGVDFDALVDCGVASDVVLGASTRARLELGYRVVVDGRVARAHRSFYEAGNPSLQPRIAVQKKVGALDPAALDQHGTSMAAIAAGSPWSTTNADSGHAPGARIASYACADDSQGNALTSTILKAWEKLACDVEPLDIEAAVIGFSGSPDPLSAEQRMLDAVARNTD